MMLSRRSFIGGLLATTAVARVPVPQLTLSGVPIVFDGVGSAYPMFAVNPEWKEGLTQKIQHHIVYGTEECPLEFTGFAAVFDPPVV